MYNYIQHRCRPILSEKLPKIGEAGTTLSENMVVDALNPVIQSTPSPGTEAGPRIQFVSATLVFGLAAFDCSLAISSSHTSLGVL